MRIRVIGAFDSIRLPLSNNWKKLLCWHDRPADFPSASSDPASEPHTGQRSIRIVIISFLFGILRDSLLWSLRDSLGFFWGGEKDVIGIVT